jgi:hypothetical protein
LHDSVVLHDISRNITLCSDPSCIPYPTLHQRRILDTSMANCNACWCQGGNPLLLCAATQVGSLVEELRETLTAGCYSIIAASFSLCLPDLALVQGCCSAACSRTFSLASPPLDIQANSAVGSHFNRLHSSPACTFPLVNCLLVLVCRSAAQGITPDCYVQVRHDCVHGNTQEREER